MREIPKYRAWHIAEKKMCKVDTINFDRGAFLVGILPGEDLWLENGKTVIAAPPEGRFCAWDDFILLEYTGIKDKSGKEIYGEGDIYKDANGIISVVKMAVDGWALFPIKKGPVRNLYWYNVCNTTKGEVIGNVHQNPELLEKQ